MKTENLKFSEPVCRYESLTEYKNPQTGQVFEIIARGPDQEGVANFIKEINVYLEVKPDGPLYPPEDQKDSELETSENNDVEPAITFEIEVIDSGDIEPPFIVDFEIDPPISKVNRTSPQHYPFYSASDISVTIHANSGNLTASLSGSGPTRRANVANPGNSSNSLFGNSPSPTTFTVNVSGQGTFDLSGSYRTSAKHGR